MTYAQVTEANEVTTVAGRLPNAARRLDSRAWVLGFPTAPVELQEACGWFPVVDTPKPADTPTDTHDRSVELVNGQPTVVWTPRPWTPDELAARTANANDATIRFGALAALSTNRDFLADANVTNADIVAQVRALTRQNQALIRLALGELSGTE